MRLHLIYAPLLPAKGTESMAKLESGETLEPPVGLLYLAAYIRKYFPLTEIKITNGLLLGHEKTLTEIKDFDADLIGLSAATTSATGAYKLSRWLKKRFPDKLVVIGGPHATFLPEDTLRGSQADFVALGEGEEILREIVSTFYTLSDLSHLSNLTTRLRKIPGLAYLDSHSHFHQNPLMPLIKNLDDLPFPARDLLDYKNYSGWILSKNKKQMSIFSTRGCPYKCTFCSNGVWKLQKPYIRLRSPKNVMDEVAYLIKNFGLEEYFDQADEINADLNWALRLCEEKIKRKITLPWKCMLRADKVTPELAKLLKKSGCWYVHLGIESGNQKTLDGIGKNICLDQVAKSCKLLKAEGIKIMGLFMLYNVWEERTVISSQFSVLGSKLVGSQSISQKPAHRKLANQNLTTDNRKPITENFPRGTRDTSYSRGTLRFESTPDSQNTLNFAKKLLKEGLIDFLSWSQATPYPGSELYETALKYHLIPQKYFGHWEYWNHNWSFIMNLPGVSPRDRLKLKTQGSLLQAYTLLKSGRLTVKSLPYLLSRGLLVVKHLLS